MAAAELGRFIKDRLKRLQHLPDHPGNSSQLVEEEHEALRVFFGEEVPVVAPPPELFEVLKVAEAEGFGKILEPIYFPAVEFKQAGRYPGWKVKPNEGYWNQIRAGGVNRDAAKLGGYWGFFDKSRRPNYAGGRQMFSEDPLAPILSQARKESKIAVRHFAKKDLIEGPGFIVYPAHFAIDVPEGSRFAFSPDEQDQVVFPKLAKILRLAEGVARVRRPTVMEFNFAGNLRYSHLGEVNTREWLYDKFKDDRLRRIRDDWLIGICGGSLYGGLANVGYFFSDYHDITVAFRPLVVFFPKLG